MYKLNEPTNYFCRSISTCTIIKWTTTHNIAENIFLNAVYEYFKMKLLPEYRHDWRLKKAEKKGEANTKVELSCVILT